MLQDALKKKKPKQKPDMLSKIHQQSLLHNVLFKRQVKNVKTK